MNNLTVTKSNALIKASYRLTLLEKRIILFGIAKINPMRAENEMPLTHTINITELADFYHLERNALYSSVKTALCERLFNRQIVVKSDDDKEGTLDRWIDHVRYDENSKTFTYHFNSRLKEHLINLEENFTKYTLKNMEHLKSIYSMRLYEISIFRLKASKKTAINFAYSVSKIKEMLDIADIYNDRNGLTNFKARVLDTSRDEISEHTDLTMDYEMVRNGRAVDGVKFIISFKNPKPKETTMKTETETLPITATPATPEPAKKASGEYIPAAWMPRLDKQENTDEDRAANFKQFAAENAAKEAEELKETHLQPKEVATTVDVPRLAETIKDLNLLIKNFEDAKSIDPLVISTISDNKEYLAQALARKEELAKLGFNTNVENKMQNNQNNT